MQHRQPADSLRRRYDRRTAQRTTKEIGGDAASLEPVSHPCRTYITNDACGGLTASSTHSHPARRLFSLLLFGRQYRSLPPCLPACTHKNTEGPFLPSGSSAHNNLISGHRCITQSRLLPHNNVQCCNTCQFVIPPMTIMCNIIIPQHSSILLFLFILYFYIL